MPSRGRVNQRDPRGNVWYFHNVTPEEQAAWEAIRGAWATATDEEIAEAKTAMLGPFPFVIKSDEVKGMACRDFIYLFDDTRRRHFFVPTGGEEQKAMCYDCQGTGQADMAFAPDCTYNIVKSHNWDNPIFKVFIPSSTGNKPFEATVNKPFEPDKELFHCPQPSGCGWYTSRVNVR
jgi:hypothetical protein